MYLYRLLLYASIVVGLLGLVVLFFQTLWNMTMPEVFDLRELTFWQAVRLLLIAGFLAGPGCVGLNIGGRAIAAATGGPALTSYHHDAMMSYEATAATETGPGRNRTCGRR